MGAKPLLIVESPSKARTISRYLGGEYDVIACVGHIKDLPKKDLGIDVENNFKMTLKVLPDRREFIKKMKSMAKTAPKIIIATDPDREGEAIADHLAGEIPNSNIERVQFTEITKQGILAGMEKSHPIDKHLVDAQKTRRIIDRLVGYKISPVLWSTLQRNMKFVKTALSAGRVQSAAVKILVDRERERAAFHQAVYFDLKALLGTPSNEEFISTLYQLNGKRLAIGKDFDKNTGVLSSPNALMLNESQATALVEELKPGTWTVTDIDEKPQTSRPRPPFTTSTLQQEAGRKLRFPARKTMRTAQHLYESGFITYMRTDSTHLSTEACTAARIDIEQLYGKEYLPDKPIHYATKVKNAQEAHEAIRPAGSRFTPINTVAKALGSDAARLYELIWKRTMACQMKPARLKQTTVYITNQNAVFRSRGKVILFPGYMRAYVEGSDKPGTQLADKETRLPDLRVKDQLLCKDLSAEEHVTKPPARFTEASLIKELETLGIGRPSTYASIIETIQRRDYVTNKKGILIPTFLAVAVTQLLENHFESLVNAQFTARMEDSLDAIARGELVAVPFINSFYYGKDEIVGLDQMLQARVDIRRACTIEIPMDEDQPIFARVGRYGPYLQQNEERRSIPMSIALGDLTLQKAQELFRAADEPDSPLGTDPKTGEPVFLKEGLYGLYVQLGYGKTRKTIPKGISPEDVNLELALQLLSLPRTLGNHPETGEPVQADYGRYGPYIRHGKTNAKLRPPHTPLTVTLEEALEILKQRNMKSIDLCTVGKHPETGEPLIIKEGRFGPYATDGKVNAALPKDSDPKTISFEDVVKLINKKRTAPSRKWRRRKQ